MVLSPTRLLILSKLLPKIKKVMNNNNLKNKNFKLSILIPTYNRSKHLEKCLQSIFEQVLQSVNYINNIEILVSDNCSEDTTQEVLEKYSSNKFINFRFWKNTKNLGFDRSVYKLICESSGQFCWIFGDDEFLVNNGLESVFSILDEKKYLGHLYINNKSHLNIQKTIRSSAKMIHEINFMISFITANIFNKKLINWSTDYESFMGLNLIQEVFYFQAILSSKENIILHKKIFDTERALNIGGYSLFKTFGENQNIIFNYFRSKGLQSNSINYINKQMLKSYFPLWIYSKRSGFLINKFEYENILDAMKPAFGKYKYFWIYCYPIIKLPLPVASVYCVAIKILNKINNFKNLK